MKRRREQEVAEKILLRFGPNAGVALLKVRSFPIQDLMIGVIPTPYRKTLHKLIQGLQCIGEASNVRLEVGRQDGSDRTRRDMEEGRHQCGELMQNR
jgi:hypothetical protein